MTLTTASPEKKRKFLAALADTCNVTKSAGLIGTSRETVYEWRKKDQEFAAAWEEARALGAEALEDEAIRRAFEGFDEPLSHKGYLTGDVVKRTSDTLLIFLLKGAKPEKYKDRVANEHSGAVGVVAADIDDEAAADKLAAILANVAERRAKSAEDLA